MISRTLPKAKKSTSTAQSHATTGNRISPVGRIAHELINQLTVVNLVGHDILSASTSGPAATTARDREIFARAMHDATVLAEQLADYLAAQQVNAAAAQNPTIREHGQVVRLLRSVNNPSDNLPPGSCRREKRCD